MKQKYSYIRIRNMRDRGYTLREIAAEFGCAVNTVVRALSDDIDGIRKAEREKKRQQRLCPDTKKCDNGVNQKSAQSSKPLAGFFYGREK